MDKLLALQPIHTHEANLQAEEVSALMIMSMTENKDFAVYYPAKEMHPLVFFVLTSKGYRVQDVTTKNADGTIVFGANRCYRISL